MHITSTNLQILIDVFNGKIEFPTNEQLLIVLELGGYVEYLLENIKGYDLAWKDFSINHLQSWRNCAFFRNDKEKFFPEYLLSASKFKYVIEEFLPESKDSK